MVLPLFSKRNIHIWGKQVHWENASKMKLKQQRSRKLSTNEKVEKKKDSTFSSMRLPSGENFYPVCLSLQQQKMLAEKANHSHSLCKMQAVLMKHCLGFSMLEEASQGEGPAAGEERYAYGAALY